MLTFTCATSACGGSAQESNATSGGGATSTAGTANGDAGTDGDGANAGDNAGGAHGGAGAPTAGATDGEQAIYADYLAQWLVARSEREPGEPIPPVGVDAPCFDCVTSRGLARCSYPAGADCAPYTACIERHCLDTDSYPASLDDCVESCLPSNDVSCHAQWLAFVSCSVPACAAVCD
ncbi:MAG: hypothetical protein ABI488_19245 [Polyangiaceae bacterium]